ncbi:hypothetical protein OAB57_03975, partial [Bacteriovoracaceae bacterium]|nr:hypothetical protein [Bacteriovoracaceae bacterium]
YNSSNHYEYRNPTSYYDKNSAVICFPDNYKSSGTDLKTEGIVRVTFMANFKYWQKLPKKEYRAKKEEVYQDALFLIRSTIGDVGEVVFKDVFTPTTILRYTGHTNGTVYGGELKLKEGKTSIPNLYIAGTDQGFLGIVGAMLSGVTIANKYCIGE